MTAAPVPPPSSTLPPDDFVADMSLMVRAFWASPLRTILFALAGAVLVVIAANAWVQTLLNAWNQPFYDALARRDLPAFGRQLLAFAGIAGALLALNVAQSWLNQMSKLKLREGLVRDLLGEWLKPRRAFRLANSGDAGVNPDQRLHEDARRLTELSTDLGIGLLQSSILLGTFVSVLWSISGSFALTLGGVTFAIPGYMVWAAFLYVGAASWLSWRVGAPLIRLNADRYAREADLRFSLVRVSEHIDAIALQDGEADEQARLGLDLAAVIAAMRRLVTVVTRLTWVTAGYGWSAMIAPIIIAAPVYFSGTLTFGGLMVAVGAFNQVQASLRWFIDNFSIIADWRAILMRVAGFRRAVEDTESLTDAAGRIEIVRGAGRQIVLSGLSIASPSGSTRLRETEAAIPPGGRVMVLGEPGDGKTLLFRTLAGLWPLGAGRVTLPEGATILFIPRTPYVPPGRLAASLAYPNPPDRFTPQDCGAALAAVGLDHLVPRLDTAARWDKDLGEDERQALAFARLVLFRPDWAIVDEALDRLEDTTRSRVLDLLTGELRATGLVHIGRLAGQDALFDSVLHLEKVPEGALPPRPPRRHRR